MKATGVVLAVAGLLMAPAASADFVGFGAGAALWQHTPSGSVSYQGGDIDMKDRNDGLGLEKDRDGMVWAHVEHFVPLLPNVRLMHTQVSNTGQGSMTHAFGSYTYTGDVDSALDMTQTDAVLYWELLDNWVEVDLGLQARLLDGEIRVRDTGTQEERRANFSGTLPMGYARAAVHIPATGLSVELAGSGIGYDGHRITDLIAQINYKTSFGLGVVAGWREQRLKLDEMDGVSADVRIEGPFAGAFYRF